MNFRNKLLVTGFVLLCCLAPHTHAQLSRPKVRPGVEVLQRRGFEGLRGKRVGLVTNPSGVDSRLRSTIDILREAPEVKLVKLFGPEHGVRGDVWAGGKVADSKDPRTGLPVISLYGAHREPTDEMLEGIDEMVYDIQDVGTRSYTFISTLGLVMRACARKGIGVTVLDRPNPLGGEKMEGAPVEPGCFSFVSQYPIPYVYGLTVGELALLINEEGLNRGQKGDQPALKCKLTVVPMNGWKRGMLYEDTGLPWILPSPNIPTAGAALCYPCAGIVGEFPLLNIGVGYTFPFAVFAAEWIDAGRLKDRLDSYGLGGTVFREIHFRPTAGSMAGKLVHGVQFFFTDYAQAEITLTQFYVLQAIHELWPSKDPFKAYAGRTEMFDKVCGTRRVRERFSASFRVEDIRELWMGSIPKFARLAARYHLYD